MSPFEFVFALVSIVTSLALTRIITGVVAIIRHEERESFSPTHALWVWTAFSVVIGNWGALWSARVYPDWPAVRVLFWLTSLSCLYAFCVFVLPEIEPGKPINLKAFHEREGRRYILAHNVFALVAMVLIITLSVLGSRSPQDLVPPAAALLFGSVALFTKGRIQLAASVLVAMVATAFMVARISIVSAGPS